MDDSRGEVLGVVAFLALSFSFLFFSFFFRARGLRLIQWGGLFWWYNTMAKGGDTGAFFHRLEWSSDRRAHILKHPT